MDIVPLAHIYMIRCKDENFKEIYVGSTKDIRARETAHRVQSRYRTNWKLYEIINQHGGWANWEFTSINSFPFQNKVHLKMREDYWIQLLKPGLNRNRSYLSHEDRVKYQRTFSQGYYRRNKASICARKARNYQMRKLQQSSNAA